MQKRIARTSRHLRQCQGCRGWIAKGDRYWSHIASPNHGELGNVRWWRSPECAACAERYDRPIPASKKGNK